MKPSERIKEIINEKDFDYRDGCGALNCCCYENDVAIQAILKFLDEPKNDPTIL